MLTESQIQEFHEKGYLRAGKVLTDDEVEALRERLDRVMDENGEAQPELLRNLAGADLYATGDDEEDDDHMPTGVKMFASRVVVQIVNIWEADSLFNAHIYNPKITAMVAQLCNTDTLRVWHDQIQYKPPHIGAKTGWHQDYPAWPILEPGDLVSAWVALDDATVENGCMSMVPGSHKWGIHRDPNGGRGLSTGENFELGYNPDLIPEGEEAYPVPMEVRAGEVAFHHCLTWHGSPQNPSEQKRRAIAVHYMPGYTRFVPIGSHVMDHRVEVEVGEVLKGKYFPTVWEDGPLTPAPLPHLMA